MSPKEQQLQDVHRIERYRTLRNWAWGLALVMFVLGIGAAGIGAGDNPTSTSSANSAFTIAEYMRSAAIGLVSAGFALVTVGSLLNALSRRKHGEV
jgi:hypothetical protein